VTGHDGHLPLHSACYHGTPLDVVRYLVQEYPESLQATDNPGKLSLYHACACRSLLDVVQYLVQEYSTAGHKNKHEDVLNKNILGDDNVADLDAYLEERSLCDGYQG
jgi:ankyrin repeat protein